jgi:hypothetical protein
MAVVKERINNTFHVSEMKLIKGVDPHDRLIRLFCSFFIGIESLKYSTIYSNHSY